MRASTLFGPLLRRAHPVDVDSSGVRSTALRRDGLLAVDPHGTLVYNGRARAEVAGWVWSLAHVLTHLGLGHADPAHRDGRGSYSPEWRAACCVVVDRFLGVLHLPGAPAVPPFLDGDEEGLARRFTTHGIPAAVAQGPAGDGADLWENLVEARRARSQPTTEMWGRAFAEGLAALQGAPLGPPPEPDHRPGGDIRALGPGRPSTHLPATHIAPAFRSS